MSATSGWNKMGLALAAGTICLVFAVSSGAQVQTQTTTASGKASKTVQVDRGQVILVDGNDLMVKMEDGTIQHFPNIPDSARITVDGKSVGIHDLKPGMTLQRTITVTTTPQVVTTVQTVTGRVFHVSPPNSVILTMENGKNQSFRIPNGQKFTINGQVVDAFGLRKGMNVSATKIVEEPMIVAEHQKEVTGSMPPPPAPPPAGVPVLIVMVTRTPAPAAEAAAAPAQLPKTASQLPLVGLLGLLCISASFVIRLIRL